MLRARLPKILYEYFAEQFKSKWEDIPQVHSHYEEFADLIITEIPKISAEWLKEKRYDDSREGDLDNFLADAINEKIRGKK